MEKRGFFLTTDAFIAIAIVFFGIILFVSSMSSEPYKPQAVFFANDIVNSIGTTKIYEISETEKLVYLKKYKDDEEIMDFQNTLLSQSLEFIYRYENGCTYCFDMAKNLSRELIENLVLAQFSMNYSIYIPDFTKNYTLHYNLHQNIAGVNHSIEKSSLVFSSKQIVIRSINETQLGVGIAEVVIWQ